MFLFCIARSSRPVLYKLILISHRLYPYALHYFVAHTRRMACSALRSSSFTQHLPKSRTTSMHTHLNCAAAALAAGVVLLQLAVVCPAALPAAPVDGSSMHHLHFYMHDGYTGPSPTAVLIVNGTAPVMTGVRFGDTVVMDDVLTEGPSRGSRVVGRAQGMYVTASLQQGAPAMLLSMNVVLTDYDGGYSGSTVAVMGRNDIVQPVRELAVVGGTGRFRMATGYVLWKTASWRGKNAVLELDVYVRA